MVEREIRSFGTVLAGKPVAFHDVAPRKHDFCVGQADVAPQTNYRWIGIIAMNCAEFFVGIVVQKFRFLKKNQFYRPLHRTDTEWLIILIEYEDGAVHGWIVGIWYFEFAIVEFV